MPVCYLIGALAVLVGATAIVKRPIVGLYLLTACAVLVEAQPLEISVLTDRLHVYSWPPELAGRAERPIGLCLLFVLVVVGYRRWRDGRRPLDGGPLLWPFAVFLLFVAWGCVRGWLAGGVPKIIVLEARPFCYLFFAYLLAFNVIDTPRQVRALLWIIIVGVGVKALQGLYVYLVVLHGHLEGHRDIMAHEDSFFLATVIVLFAVFAFHHRDPRQYSAILLLLPFLAVAMIANQRRVAYLALLAGTVVAWTLAFLLSPPRRRQLLTILSIGLPLIVFYVLAFFPDTTFLARPAHGIVSVFYPDPAEDFTAKSNLYRAMENDGLLTTIRQDPWLGRGFGRPFLPPVALPDLSQWNAYYLYIPHNGIYWVWMRLGLIGFLALWLLLGSLIVRGALIAERLHDQAQRTVAIFVVAVTIMEILVAYADYQLYVLRNVLYLGVLAGAQMKLPTLGEDRSAGRAGYHRAVTAGVRA
ncbi:MAG TPA: O-antigen ligase family protein [Candidatus Methylomirabilis sp.]|nr:O-antigen ligase family protein [Candidatus Methylomirabilis sp.]